MPTYIRQDMATISVDFDQPVLGVGLPRIKSWATLEGGDLESEDTKTRPGGMVDQVNLGGPTTRTDATVTRPYTNDLHPFIVGLEDRAGNGTLKITWTILDALGKAHGRTYTLRGILKNVMRPNWDANATGAAHLSLVVGCNVQQTGPTS